MRFRPYLIIILATLTCFAQSSALASRWVLFNGFFKNSPKRFYIDFDSVRQLPNNQVFVWLKLEELKPVDGISKTLVAKKFNCSTRKAIGVQMIFYKPGQTQPEIDKREDVRDIHPGSALEDAFKLSCIAARNKKANRPPNSTPPLL